MNPEIPAPNPRAELEARVTAYLLGELPAHEAAALRAKIEDDAQLAQLIDRLRPTISLVREATVHAAPMDATAPAPAPAAPLQLSPDRREKLLAQFKTIRPKEFAAKPRTHWTPLRIAIDMAAVLAVLGIMSAMLLPALSKAKAKAVRINISSNLKQIELAKQMWAEDNKKSANDTPTAEDLKNYGLPRSVLGETYNLGRVGEQPTAELDAAQARKELSSRLPSQPKPLLERIPLLNKLAESSTPSAADRVQVTVDGRVAYVDKSAAARSQMVAVDAVNGVVGTTIAQGTVRKPESKGLGFNWNLGGYKIRSDGTASPVAAGVPPAVLDGPLPPGNNLGLSRRDLAMRRPVPPGGTPGSTAGETPAATPQPMPAAPVLPRTVIVLPSVDQGEISVKRVGSAATGWPEGSSGPIKYALADNNEPALRSLERPQTPLTAASKPPWAIGGTTRGFYDDNYNTSASGNTTRTSQINQALPQPAASNPVSKFADSPAQWNLSTDEPVQANGAKSEVLNLNVDDLSGINSPTQNRGEIRFAQSHDLRDMETSATRQNQTAQTTDSLKRVTNSGAIDGFDFSSGTLPDQNGQLAAPAPGIVLERTNGLIMNFRNTPADQVMNYASKTGSQPDSASPSGAVGGNYFSGIGAIDNGALLTADLPPTPAPAPVAAASDGNVTSGLRNTFGPSAGGGGGGGGFGGGGGVRGGRGGRRGGAPATALADGSIQQFATSAAGTDLQRTGGANTSAVPLAFNTGDTVPAPGVPMPAPVASPPPPPATAAAPAPAPALAGENFYRNRSAEIGASQNLAQANAGPVTAQRELQENYTANNGVMEVAKARLGTPEINPVKLYDRAKSMSQTTDNSPVPPGTIPSQTLIERLPSSRTNQIRIATRVQDGKLLYEAGKIDEAEDKLTQALAEDPANVAAFQELQLIKQKRMENVVRAGEVRENDSLVQVEKGWARDFKPGENVAKPDPFSRTTATAAASATALSATPSVAIHSENTVQLTNQLADAPTKHFAFAAQSAAPPLAAQPGQATVSLDADGRGLIVQADDPNFAAISGVISNLDAEKKAPASANTYQYSLSGRDNTIGSDKLALNKDFVAKQQELDQLQKSRDVLALRTFQENVEKQMPKTTMVEVIQHAEAEPASGPTLGERISGLLGGKVERKASIRLDKAARDVAGVGGQQTMQSIYDPNFIQTEFQVIQSERVLDKVIEQLDLNDTWAKKSGTAGKLSLPETRQLLRNSLDLKAQPNSSLLDIGVKSDKPEEAAIIANKVAEVYRDYRTQRREELSMGGISAFSSELAAQDQKIDQAKAYLTQMKGTAQAQAAKPSESEGRLSGTLAPPKEKESQDAPIQKPASPPLEPQPEVLTSDNAFSTFSLNVSDVSFKLAAASLEKGLMPDPGSIRSEEFINAFDYRDPEPAPGAPLAFAWERIQYPFAQNRDLVRFAVKTAAAGRLPGRPLNIVLLLDSSGSMERADRVAIIREALRVLATELQTQDTLSVVTFARTARLFVDGVPGNQAANVAEQVSGLTPEGGTNLEEAMRLAYETARRHYLAGGINRVVLLTDGAANLGNVDPAALKEKVEENRKQGIALDCFGIGWEGYNDDLLEVLSRNGDGRYGFINTPEEAATGFAGQLAGALHVAASDVKVQIEFNPRRVTAYRQIGYAKHQLTKEQFRDNTVNAAQIGAAEEGNALYTVEINPAGEGPLGTVRVRFRVPGTQDYQEHAWTLRYSGNAAPLEQGTAAMRLAATASAFSEWLGQSPYAVEVTSDQLLGYLRGVPQIYGADARPTILEWMIRQAKSLTGK